MQTSAPSGSEQDGGKHLPGNSRRSLAPSGLTCPQGTVQSQEVLLACKKSECLHVLLHPN